MDDLTWTTVVHPTTRETWEMATADTDPDALVLRAPGGAVSCIPLPDDLCWGFHSIKDAGEGFVEVQGPDCHPRYVVDAFGCPPRSHVYIPYRDHAWVKLPGDGTAVIRPNNAVYPLRTVADLEPLLDAASRRNWCAKLDAPDCVLRRLLRLDPGVGVAEYHVGDIGPVPSSEDVDKFWATAKELEAIGYRPKPAPVLGPACTDTRLDELAAMPAEAFADGIQVFGRLSGVNWVAALPVLGEKGMLGEALKARNFNSCDLVFKILKWNIYIRGLEGAHVYIFR